MKKLLLTLATIALATMHSYAGESQEISLDDLKTAIATEQIFLIDVNGSSAYAKGHIPGAIDFEAHQATLAELLPEDKSTLIVAYCSGPLCSAHKMATSVAIELGYTNVKHFTPGIQGWVDAGEAVEKES